MARSALTILVAATLLATAFATAETTTALPSVVGNTLAIKAEYDAQRAIDPDLFCRTVVSAYNSWKSEQDDLDFIKEYLIGCAGTEGEPDATTTAAAPATAGAVVTPQAVEAPEAGAPAEAAAPEAVAAPTAGETAATPAATTTADNGSNRNLRIQKRRGFSAKELFAITLVLQTAPGVDAAAVQADLINNLAALVPQFNIQSVEAVPVVTPPRPGNTPIVSGPVAAPISNGTSGQTITVNIVITILGFLESFDAPAKAQLIGHVEAALSPAKAVITATTATTAAAKFTQQAAAIAVDMTVTVPAAQYPNVNAVVTRLLTVLRNQNNRFGDIRVVSVRAAGAESAASKAAPVVTLVAVLMVLVGLMF